MEECELKANTMCQRYSEQNLNLTKNQEIFLIEHNQEKYWWEEKSRKQKKKFKKETVVKSEFLGGFDYNQIGDRMMNGVQRWS